MPGDSPHTASVLDTYVGTRVARSATPISFGRIVGTTQDGFVVRNDDDGLEHTVPLTDVTNGTLVRLPEEPKR